MRHRVMQHVPPVVRMDIRMIDRAFLGTASLRDRLSPMLLRYTSSFCLTLLLKGLQGSRHDELLGYMARWQ